MLGNALDEYVRWEENVLFPAIESLMSDEELDWLAGATEEIEKNRRRPTQRLHASVAGAQTCVYSIDLHVRSRPLEVHLLKSIESKNAKAAVAV